MGQAGGPPIFTKEEANRIAKEEKESEIRGWLFFGALVLLLLFLYLLLPAKINGTKASTFIGKTSNEKVGENWWYNMAMHEIIKNQASSKMPG